MCDRTTGFSNVLSVWCRLCLWIVQWSVSGVLMMCFLRCAFERQCCELSRSLFKKAAFGGNAILEPADPSIADFLEHLTAAYPCSVIHTGQKCPQFCGTGKSRLLNELHFEPVPQKEFQVREVWRARWLKLNCAVEHCLAVLTSQPAGVRWRVVQDQ